MMNRLVIVGAGAIGGCIGGLLCSVGKPVVMVARGEHGRIIQSQGLEVVFPGRSIRCEPECYSDLASVRWSEDDVVLIATKLNDAEPSLHTIKQLAGAKIPVVCASNGIQGELWARQIFENVVAMMIWMPSVHLEPGDVRVYGESCPGVLDVGPVQGPRADHVSTVLQGWLQEAGFDSQSRNNIMHWKYAKWITNLGNAAQALVQGDWRRVAKAAQIEGEKVLDATGMDRVATQLLLDRVAHIKLQSIHGERRPGGSTWQSLQRGRPLETKWLEGAMADLADQYQLDAPVCRALADAADARRQTTADDILADGC